MEVKKVKVTAKMADILANEILQKVNFVIQTREKTMQMQTVDCEELDTLNANLVEIHRLQSDNNRLTSLIRNERNCNVRAQYGTQFGGVGIQYFLAPISPMINAQMIKSKLLIKNTFSPETFDEDINNIVSEILA